MLSKDDYADYLKQILKVENDMANVYQSCMEKVDDEYYKHIFGRLVEREKEHAWNVGRLAMLLEQVEDHK